MATLNQTPFTCHVFVCTNDRQGARRSCADNDSLRLRAELKELVASRGWRTRVRVSSCGCMGLCEKGPNVILHPQGHWYSAVTPADIPQLVKQLEEIMG
jgi:(2Fe-2S) ferredoxin